MALKKNTLETYQASFPDIIKSVGEYLKLLVSKDSVEILSTSTGTIATVVKIFSKPLIDRAFSELADNQLKKFGLETYLKTAIDHGSKCLEHATEKESQTLTDDIKNELIGKTLPSIIQEQINNISVETALIFQPKFHPIVILIKNIFLSTLTRHDYDELTKNKFLKEFNAGIAEKVASSFGNNYERHLEEVKAFHLTEKEVEILNDIIQNAKIGFDDQEKIDYVETYGSWHAVNDLEKLNQTIHQDEIEGMEKRLVPVKDLIKEYFNNETERTLEKLLFIIADFGKGKSVFLKTYASELAKTYLSSSEGYFPIYFNLRDFNRYSGDAKNGVIYEFIETRYGVKLDDPYFKSKKYIFLVDSLDESGELVRSTIEKVIYSIKNIQKIDKEHCRDNRIVITSRPFDDGLKNQLISHLPLQRKDDNGKANSLYISLYGFKKEQFNMWLSTLLKNNDSFIATSKGAYSKQIIQGLTKENVFDIHSTLIKDRTLSYEELKRPIFGYMIYQLLINDYDFFKVGKIGVYLSFINLLSKEAKYIHDKGYSFSLVEQFECRNILHTISSLWGHERISGKQGSLKKADICRAIEGDNIDLNDERVLEKYKGQGINEISFLSHSYFGENDSVLHFQHQSFAEILLAEFYLKILIKCSLDRTVDINFARKKLFVGHPSPQTLDFLKGLLILFRDTCSSEIDDEIIEKRRLIFPFIASIANEKYNKDLSSDVLFYEWFNKFNWTKSISSPPMDLLKNWFFNNQSLSVICDLCKSVIEDESYELLLSKSTHETSIYDQELTKIKYADLNVREIDKLICLFAGNLLTNNVSKKTFFLQRFSNSSTIKVITALLSRQVNTLKAFKSECFKGVNLTGEDYLNADDLDLIGVDFSFSNLSNLSFKHVLFHDTNFSNVNFTNVDFSFARLTFANFEHTTFKESAHFALASIGQGVLFPYILAYSIYNKNNTSPKVTNNFLGIYSCEGDMRTGLSSAHADASTYLKSFRQIITFFVDKKTLTKEDVVKGFYFKEKGLKELFKAAVLDSLN